MAEAQKKWGRRDFWGVGIDYDPCWYLTESQLELQREVMELCRTTLRPNAVVSDETYKYPRENMSALGDLRLLSLIVPKELGGRGENHQCAVMVCETIARYGCPSTAMVYVMHLGAIACLCFRYHDNPHIKDLLRRIDDEKLIGTLSYSDPATGGHFWYALSSKCWKLSEDCYRILKFASWTTSAGFADFYVMQTVSPGFNGDFSNLTNFLVYKDEVRGNTEDWSALGMHGNQSGPLVMEATVKAERRIGPVGDGRFSNDEGVDSFFLLLSSSVWNGIAMGAIDLAKRHVVSKTHGDVGMRVCDYPTIQDYFGQCMSKTNSARSLVFGLALAYDKCTKDCDWSVHSDLTVLLRADYLHWGWQAKFVAAQNVAKVCDTMLKATGGSGYKTELGLERLLRDGKAGCVMGPTNEIVRGWVGKSVLLGLEVVDFWNQTTDQRVLRGELRKMNRDEKRELAEKLMYEANIEESDDVDGFDFDNPLSATTPTHLDTIKDGKVTHKPALNSKTFTKTTLGDIKYLTNGKVTHKAALNSKTFTKITLRNIKYLTSDNLYAMFTFDYPDKHMHSGCLNGQYVQMELPGGGGRFISPSSDAKKYGKLEAVIRYESQGVLAEYLKTLKVGDGVGFRGPCGGLEYTPNAYTHMVFLCGGVGVTPALQIIRGIISDPSDTTKVTMFYQAKNLDELLFREELDGYAGKSDDFSVVYTLQDMDEAWEGSDGYIDSAFLQQHMPPAVTDSSLKDMDEAWEGSDGYIDSAFLHQHMPPAVTDGSLKVVVCGGSAMITVCLGALSLLKFRSQDIYIYGAFAAEQIRSVYGRNVKTFEQ